MSQIIRAIECRSVVEDATFPPDFCF